MLIQSERLELVTFDSTGKEISRQGVAPFREYFMEHGQAVADAAKVQVGPNQKVEIVSYLNASRYQQGWDNGLIF